MMDERKKISRYFRAQNRWLILGYVIHWKDRLIECLAGGAYSQA